MAATDPDAEWIGNVQPVGLVLASTVLARYGLNPAKQTRADSEAVRDLLSDDNQGPALPDPWAFFVQVLGWRAAQVAGAPGGPVLPEDLSVRVEEGNTELTPHWAVADPEKGWQILVRIEGPGVDPEQRGALEGWEATPHQQLERLLRETRVPTGLLLTDGELRFIQAPRGETSGWLKFPLRSLSEVGGRPMLGGLKLILSCVNGTLNLTRACRYRHYEPDPSASSPVPLASGLTTILAEGGAISRATRRLKWPGEAAVVVSVVHVVKGQTPQADLDGRPVRRISAYLVQGSNSPVIIAN